MAATARPTGSVAASALTPTDASLLLMATIWGVNYIVVKYGAGAFGAVSYNAVRLAIATVALLGLAAVRRAPWPTAGEAARLLALGVLGNGVYQLLFILGLTRTRAGTAAVILAASPAFIALLSRALASERLRPRALAGIALSMLGVGVVVLGHARDAAAPGDPLGVVLLLLACVAWAAYTVLLRPYTVRVDGICLTGVTMAGGAIPLGVYAVPSLVRTSWGTVSPLAWGALAYGAIGALVVGYVIWYRGLRVLGSTRTAMYGNLQPAIAVIAAWPLLGEQPTPWQGAGMLCIMLGILLVRT